MFVRHFFDQVSMWEETTLRRAQVIFLCLVFASVAIFPNPSTAQSASFRSVDTNADRVLTLNELVAAFGRNGANRLLRTTDHNGDGRITISELRRGADDEDQGDDQRPGLSNDRDDDREDNQRSGSSRDSGSDRDDAGDDGDDGKDDGDGGDGDDGDGGDGDDGDDGDGDDD